MDRVDRAGSGTLAAKRTIYGIDSTILPAGNIDAIRASLGTEAAMGTLRIILHDMENLELRLSAKNLKQIACHAECSQQYPPRDIESEHAEQIICSEEHNDPNPELEGVGDSSERAQVLAPEHVDQESEDQHH